MVGTDTARLRMLAAWLLLAYSGVTLFFAFLSWVTGGDDTVKFTIRSYLAAGGATGTSFAGLFGAGFLSLPVLGAIALAVLLAYGMRGSAKLIALVALIELAVAFVFGLLAWLIGLGEAFDLGDNAQATYAALTYLFATLAVIGLVAVTLMWTMQLFTASGGRMPNMSGPSGPSGPDTGQSQGM